MTAFIAILQRDLVVLRRNIVDFILRIGVQPILFSFILGSVLPDIGQIPRDFASVVLPGIVGFSSIAAGVQGVAIPLAWDFGTTKEIEDRLMAPISAKAVMLEKILIGTVQAWVAGLVVFPVAYLIMRENLNLTVTDPLALALVVTLAGLLSATLGMVLGTIVEPMKFAMMFALVIIPMIFLGATYYPWAELASIRWLQLMVLANPLVYVNEAFRAILTPSVPHMHLAYSVLGMTVSTSILMIGAMIGFRRRSYE